MVDITGVDEFTARIITADQFVGPFFLSYVGVSGSYNMTTSDTLIVCDASSGPVTVTLISASGNSGQYVYIKDNGSATTNSVTINPANGETIDGETSLSIIRSYDSVTLVSDGTNEWLII